MISSIASMVAVLAAQSNQSPTVVQCALPIPEPWWRWLLPTIVQTVVSLASITAGVWIALWSFRATSKKDHDRWVLDQKKAEWSSLLHSVANVYQITYLANGWHRKIADRIVSELEQAVREVSFARANCVFLDKFRLNNEGSKKITEFLRSATIQSQRIKGNLGLFDSIQERAETTGPATDSDDNSLLRTIEVVSSEILELAEQSCNLLVWLQNEAALDLDLTEEGK